LGNYYDYLPSNKQQSISQNKMAKQEYDVAANDPHNVFFSTFAETGIFGLSTFIFILLYFLKKDLIIFRNKTDGLDKAFIISFWTLFIYSLANPSSSITYMSLFWLTRLVIYKMGKFEVIKR
jgi:O-antigen ligase